jgi:peptidoglycan/LPS O-acetylase OafA/YrhL
MTQFTEQQPAAVDRRPRHLPALDGLRGLAIAGVLLFHTGLMSGGFLGVDLFFVLSGFLITSLLLREARTTGTVGLVSFWGRRVRRLVPALATMLVTVTLVVWGTASPDLVRTTLSDGPWVQANLVNWHLIAESAAYWDRFGPGRVFEHLWSIAVEEQFYLAWPPVVVAVAAFGRRLDQRVGLVAALVSVGSLVAMIALTGPGDPTRVYTGTDTRAFSLLLGALVATEGMRRALRAIPVHWVSAIVAVLLVVMGVGWVSIDGVSAPWLFTGGLFAHSLASAALIGLCARDSGSAVVGAVARRPLEWLGSISYSLYLWHWPVIVLLGGPAGWARAAVVCAVSVGLAAVSKYAVEDPIRFRAGWARGRRGAVAFVVLMIALALFWIALPAPAVSTVDVTDLD